MTILYFVLGLGLLIFVHEFGHFIVAKLSGIRVERFSLGFGPHIGFKIGETEYCLSALPLGGYVKMSGQEDFGEEEITPLDDPRAFNRKPLWVRLKVVLAGPFMNLLLPFILMPIVFMIGRQEPKFYHQAPVVIGVQEKSSAQEQGIQVGDKILKVQGYEVQSWQDVAKITSTLRPNSTVALEVERSGQPVKADLTLKPEEGGQIAFLGIEPIFFIDNDPLIGAFAEESPAKGAGFQSGDVVLEIQGVPVKSWLEMSEQVNRSEGKPLQFKVKRGAEEHQLTVTPIFNSKLKKYVIGISKGSNPANYETHAYPFGEAVVKGFKQNMELFGMTFHVLKDLVTLQLSIKELGGPIKIAEMSGKEAERGIGNFLFLLVFLSIQLGVLNLLPIPVLDGGHVAFMTYEAIAGKPLSPKKRLIAQQVGMFLLLTLMVVVTVNDIDSVWGYKHILESVKGFFSNLKGKFG